MHISIMQYISGQKLVNYYLNYIFKLKYLHSVTEPFWSFHSGKTNEVSL